MTLSHSLNSDCDFLLHFSSKQTQELRKAPPAFWAAALLASADDAIRGRTGESGVANIGLLDGTVDKNQLRNKSAAAAASQQVSRHSETFNVKHDL